jgi:phosphoribosyl 1,2-cyclic phosphate phosphodiesterase
VHGPNLLIDTPEESKQQLNRSRVQTIDGCAYSHWHPDHVMGRRVWEMNQDWLHIPPQSRVTDIYLPQQVAADFRTRLGSWEQFKYMESQGIVRLIELNDGETFTLNGTRIRPFRLAQEYVYAFLLEDAGKRVLIAPDELFAWEPPADVIGVDLAILPKGLFEFDPLTGARRIDADHPVLKTEATFRQTLAMVEQLDVDRVIMTHIEEPDGFSYHDLLRLETKLHDQGYNIQFAYDTMQIDV